MLESVSKGSTDPCSLPRLILVSRALTHPVLAENRVVSSSQKFERGFARSCTQHAEVTVLNVIGAGARLSGGECLDGIQFHTVGLLHLLSAIRRIGRGRSTSSVITTGYDPALMSVLVACRNTGIPAFTFIYDTHKISMQGRPLYRRAAIDAYFSIGLCIARLLNGWIVLNDRFIVASRLPTPPHLKTRIGIDASALQGGSVVSPPLESGRRPIFLYSGTLNADNGTDILISAVRQMPGYDFELHVYGDGPQAHLVQSAADVDPRIRFFGKIANEEVVKKQHRADILIHLRDPSSPSSMYSYPSKIIEYICSRRPVASNVLPVIDDVKAYLTLIDDFSSTSIRKTLSGIIDGSTPAHQDPTFAALLYRKQNWAALSSEIIRFVGVQTILSTRHSTEVASTYEEPSLS